MHHNKNKKKMEEPGLTEEERKAMRGSKFAPLSSRPPTTRLAHPGGPLTTNKAAALAKFLERKLQEPDGLASLNPALLERAVQNAKETVLASKPLINYDFLLTIIPLIMSVTWSGSSTSGRVIRHVASFGDPELPDSGEEDEGKIQNNVTETKPKKHKKKKNKKKVPVLA
ncbi:hypothetical protein IFM89_034627 [Coptis chinensis]|uniref:Uncharacterized protein n=1 Tax=Coptis chinensis TaxID=261450 RepID=A0A835HYC8_9MAGN|nr:hypothetical protein IFM89_034627 [Coptis chinensis]